MNGYVIIQVLLVLLDHQLAFLGLVESSSSLIQFLGEFALIAVGFAGVFSLGVMWAAVLLGRLGLRT